MFAFTILLSCFAANVRSYFGITSKILVLYNRTTRLVSFSNFYRFVVGSGNLWTDVGKNREQKPTQTTKLHTTTMFVSQKNGCFIVQENLLQNTVNNMLKISLQCLRSFCGC